MSNPQASLHQKKTTNSIPAQQPPLPNPTPQTPMEDHEMESPEQSPINTPEIRYEEPLYTEINIPLPPLPQPALSKPPIPPKSRYRERAHTIHSPFSFHRRRPSSPPSSPPKSAEKEMANFLGEEKRKVEKTESVGKGGAGWQEMMKGKMKGRKRNQTVDALAIVPAVLVLKAELFTPGKDAGVR